MKPLLFLLLALAVSSVHAQSLAPDPLDAVRVLDAEGQPSSLDAVLVAAADADVLFLGELHDDSLGHAVERAVWEAALAADRPAVLALEMVETDVQTVLDEYLAGLVRERDWLAAGRPWANYEADYRPLVEAARAAGAPVVASNAPGRYVSLVSRRDGLTVLDSLSAEARAWLPPSIAPPSEALAAKFTTLMGGMPHGSGPSVEGMLAGQTLRDATMAWRTAEALAAYPGALVVHVNGSFHSEGGLGIPEHLARYAPDARVVVVTMRREADGAPVPGDDFVILTGVAE
jgi:uncharacterized iron-regulated protein